MDFPTISLTPDKEDTLVAALRAELGVDGGGLTKARVLRRWLHRHLRNAYNREKVRQAGKQEQADLNKVVDDNRDRLEVAQKKYDDAKAAASTSAAKDIPEA
ncbi:MAG: hypothetical protein J3T61_04640 [Candidatus Brocadiales bacterium]|nr:hypothetical protein [Candidatus Bathyanammoxibius sp.]